MGSAVWGNVRPPYSKHVFVRTLTLILVRLPQNINELHSSLQILPFDNCVQFKILAVHKIFHNKAPLYFKYKFGFKNDRYFSNARMYPHGTVLDMFTASLKRLRLVTLKFFLNLERETNSISHFKKFDFVNLYYNESPIFLPYISC